MSWSGSSPGATRAPSAPCRPTRFRVGAAVLSLLAAVRVQPVEATDFWVQAAPVDAAEAVLRAALPVSGAVPVTALPALRAVSAAHPGTAASGLAQLAAGLMLLDANRAGEAVTHLSHPDLARTSLADHALLARARAHETAGNWVEAGRDHLALVASHAQSPLLCLALLRGAEAVRRLGPGDEVIALLVRAERECPEYRAEALLRLGGVQEARSDSRGAAATYERLDRDFPGSTQAREAMRSLGRLGSLLPARPAAERASRELQQAIALADGGRYKEAVVALRRLAGRGLSPEETDLARVRLGRALLVLRKEREATQVLGTVGRGSAFEAEAAFHLAKIHARRARSPLAYERVANGFPGSPWAEESLLSLAYHYQKDGRDAAALPYFKRLWLEFPDGRYTERALWRVAFADYRAGRYAEAAQALEATARRRPESLWTGGFLYWAGRAHRQLGQVDRARALFEETVRRYKHTYHGLRAGEALGLPRGGASSTHPAPSPGSGSTDLPPQAHTRLRELLLIDRFEEAMAEAGRYPDSAQAKATVAWIHWREGRLRPAITALKRAYPQWKGEGGDQLPDALWRILYPIAYRDQLVEKAANEGLDPALVAALIWQESTFDAGAVSVAGARGLMQVVPPTGRSLARGFGLRYRPGDLHDPVRSLQFGTRYLRQMIDRFGGRVERALAAYNAGASRVVTWTAARPDMPAEEFIETIPFTETRSYVMGVLAHREQYRRLYALPAPARPGASASGSP
jgi:soluble lytic murein transglycosylase